MSRDTVWVLPDLRLQGVDLIVGNDLAGSKIGEFSPPPVLQERPEASAVLQQLKTNMRHVSLSALLRVIR